MWKDLIPLNFLRGEQQKEYLADQSCPPTYVLVLYCTHTYISYVDPAGAVPCGIVNLKCR